MTEPKYEHALRKLQHYLLRWRGDIQAYGREVFGQELTHQQVAAAREFLGHKFLAIRSGHGVGKSFLLSLVVHWYLDTKRVPGRPCRVPCTGASRAQLDDVLWTEVNSLMEKKASWFSEKFDINQDRYYATESAKDCFAVLRTARREQPDALQGFHQCLYLIDEGSGVPDEVFEVAQGAMGDEGAMGFMTGNPTRIEGYFHKVFHEPTMWKTMHMPSTESLTSRTYEYRYCDALGSVHKVQVHGRQTESWVKSMAEEHGEGSATYRVRVLGKFATISEDLVVRPVWVARAREPMRVRSVDARRKKVMGVDVAWHGDDASAAVLRQGDLVYAVHEWRGDDPSIVALRTKELILDWKPDFIYVDTIGIGAGVYSILLHEGLKVRRLLSNAKPPDDNETQCRYLRDWLYWRMRKAFRRGLVFAPDQLSLEDKIWKELGDECMRPTYQYTSTLKFQVESKDKMRARGVKSPNLADALAFTFMTDMDEPRAGGGCQDGKVSKRIKQQMNRKRNWKVI